MRNLIHLSLAALVAASGIALARDDRGSARELDDASVVAAPNAPAGAIDDADRKTAADSLAADASGPLAFGVVTANGSKSSGTPNFSSTYNSTYTRYEITI